MFVGPVFFLYLGLSLPETGLELPGGGFRAFPLLGQIFLNPNQLWDGFFATKRKKMELSLITYWHFNLYPDSAWQLL